MTPQSRLAKVLGHLVPVAACRQQHRQRTRQQGLLIETFPCHEESSQVWHV